MEEHCSVCVPLERRSYPDQSLPCHVGVAQPSDPLCPTECPVSRYGPNCALTCTCASSSQCSARTGRCRCHRGSMGSSCQEGEPSPVLRRPWVLPAA